VGPSHPSDDRAVHPLQSALHSLPDHHRAWPPARPHGPPHLISTNPQPELSVIIAAYNARRTIGDCLASLAAQTTAAPFEIIVVDSSTDGTADFVAERFPQVRLLGHAGRRFPGEARNRGVAASRGRIIAFVDADCTVERDWAAELLAVHASGHGLVASAIDNGSRQSLVGWTYYFCEFNLWLPAPRPRSIPEAAACCLSFERSLFERFGPFLPDTYCSDTAFHWRLQAAGRRTFFAPQLRVYHHLSESLPAMLRHVYAHRRAFARVRCEVKRLSRGRRLLALLLEPATPALLMAAVGLRLRRCPAYLPVFALVSPTLFLAFTARALGETAGYLRGGKREC
jgi:glycosyltransferase involved in cell wall biosynthesis